RAGGVPTRPLERKSDRCLAVRAVQFPRVQLRQERSPCVLYRATSKCPPARPLRSLSQHHQVPARTATSNGRHVYCLVRPAGVDWARTRLPPNTLLDHWRMPALAQGRTFHEIDFNALGGIIRAV